MDIKLHKNDLPKDLEFGNKIAVDCEFMGLNFMRDKLCVVQISSGNSDAHIIQLDRDTYNCPNLKKLLSNNYNLSINKIFTELVPFDENDSLVCETGLNYHKSNESFLIKAKEKSKKLGFFENFFNLFSK